ncbi:MAG: hypothetical protein M3P51_04760 [Chloroflexota bacterium]|nr:hypothetical protein [Chloroflexota bacterium]
MLILLALTEILAAVVAGVEWLVLGIGDFVLGLLLDKPEPDWDETVTSHRDFPSNL